MDTLLAASEFVSNGLSHGVVVAVVWALITWPWVRQRPSSPAV
ncbi:MAG TPA: hypothetical protein VHH34_17680 [Pseudonocardiaceae bacterium]|nr:hypothetical protein [Pseudonocardiaceae bacterium]